MTERMSAEEFRRRWMQTPPEHPGPQKRPPRDFAAMLEAQIRAAGLREPEREHRFHPYRRWRFDLAWADLMLAAEVDGAVWTEGRHTRGSGFVRDCEKMTEAALAGWRVLRLVTDWVPSGRALEYVRRALEDDPTPR